MVVIKRGLDGCHGIVCVMLGKGGDWRFKKLRDFNTPYINAGKAGLEIAK